MSHNNIVADSCISLVFVMTAIPELLFYVGVALLSMRFKKYQSANLNEIQYFLAITIRAGTRLAS